MRNKTIDASIDASTGGGSVLGVNCSLAIGGTNLIMLLGMWDLKTMKRLRSNETKVTNLERKLSRWRGKTLATEL